MPASQFLFLDGVEFKASQGFKTKLGKPLFFMSLVLYTEGDYVKTVRGVHIFLRIWIIAAFHLPVKLEQGMTSHQSLPRSSTISQKRKILLAMPVLAELAIFKHQSNMSTDRSWAVRCTTKTN